MEILFTLHFGLPDFNWFEIGYQRSCTILFTSTVQPD